MPHDELELWHAVRGEPVALGVFRSSGALPVRDALSIYRNAYWIRQYEVLRELFPRVERHRGAVGFRELTRRYLHEHPSIHPELERIGARLPDFMRGGPPELAAAASIAAYEQALIESFLAADSVTASLADVRPEAFAFARMELAPSVRVVELDAALMRALAAEGKRVVGARGVVLARPALAVVSHFVTAAELELLAHVGRRATIGELVERFDHDVSGLHVVLDRWFRRRWIAALRLELP
jgi:hypothetical protein